MPVPALFPVPVPVLRWKWHGVVGTRNDRERGYFEGVREASTPRCSAIYFVFMLFIRSIFCCGRSVHGMACEKGHEKRLKQGFFSSRPAQMRVSEGGAWALDSMTGFLVAESSSSGRCDGDGPAKRARSRACCCRYSSSRPRDVRECRPAPRPGGDCTDAGCQEFFRLGNSLEPPTVNLRSSMPLMLLPNINCSRWRELRWSTDGCSGGRSSSRKFLWAMVIRARGVSNLWKRTPYRS